MLGYEDALNYIHSLLRFGIKPGLQRIKALLNELGNPQDGLKFVHIAGTNGKGTTSTMLSNILIDAGFKTGLFTSPYVFDFCERIKIDNADISRDDLSRLTQKVKSVAEKLEKEGNGPTEFEFITALALLYFKEKQCDYVVLEVGLGGRLDSTNIIENPVVEVITSISLDHINVLGNTVKEIAAEKCGIIKENSTVVTSSLQNSEALEVIKKTAKEKNARLTVADYNKVKVLNKNLKATSILYKEKEYQISLLGDHQIENTIGVIEAASVIDGVDYQNIYNGIKNTVMHGRMELIDKNTMIDGGHNEECSLALKKVITDYLEGKKITAVIGMMADKDCKNYLKNILPLCDSVIFTKPLNPRSEEPENLRCISSTLCDNMSIEIEPKKAYYKAKAEGDFVLVCGSFYLLSDIFK